MSFLFLAQRRTKRSQYLFGCFCATSLTEVKTHISYPPFGRRARSDPVDVIRISTRTTSRLFSLTFFFVLFIRSRNTSYNPQFALRHAQGGFAGEHGHLCSRGNEVKQSADTNNQMRQEGKAVTEMRAGRMRCYLINEHHYPEP